MHLCCSGVLLRSAERKWRQCGEQIPSVDVVLSSWRPSQLASNLLCCNFLASTNSWPTLFDGLGQVGKE